MLLAVRFFLHILKEKYYFKSLNFPAASNKFVSILVCFCHRRVYKSCVYKKAPECIRSRAHLLTGKEFLFTKLKCHKGLIFYHCVIFLTYFTNIDYRARTLALNPAPLLATFASRSIFGNNFFPLEPIFI